MKKTVINVNNLGKRFFIDIATKPKLLKSLKIKKKQVFWALKDVSFKIEKGSIVGLAGDNGAGKSTLLKILSKIIKPTTGTFEISGKVASLLELGTGFHPDLSGRENIFFNGALMGMDRAHIQNKYRQIVEFAGIEDFIDMPVKHYSTGMYLRLGFAVAIFLEADILIIDEVLAVGDWRFQRKCMDMIWRYSEQGKTIVIVSHDRGLLNSICDKILFLDKGRLNLIEKKDYKTLLKEEVTSMDLKGNDLRKGNGNLRLEKIWFEDDLGEEQDSVYSGQKLKVCMACTCSETIKDFIISFSIHDQKGRSLFRCDSLANNIKYTNTKGRLVFRCVIDRFPLAKGNYSFSFHAYSLGEDIDLFEQCKTFEVHSSDFWGTKYIDTHSPFLVDYLWSESVEQRQA